MMKLTLFSSQICLLGHIVLVFTASPAFASANALENPGATQSWQQARPDSRRDIMTSSPVSNIQADPSQAMSLLAATMAGAPKDNKVADLPIQPPSFASSGSLQAPSIQYIIPDAPYDWGRVRLPFRSLSSSTRTKKYA